MLYAGKIPQWDVAESEAQERDLRPLVVEQSGPEPLIDLFNFCIDSLSES